MIKIVTDTTCDLPADLFDRYRISIVPINIQFGQTTLREGIDIQPDDFYRRIETTGSLPTTSQPSVGQFCECFETLAADGSEILAIHLTSKLSGTWQSATLAARQLADRVKVTVLDSMTSSVGLGLLVREAAQLVEAGWSLPQIVPHLEARRSQMAVFILLKDLRYARMSGRVGRIRETLASVLKVKPIIGVNDGALIPLERVRGQKQGIARMIALARETVGNAPVHLAVAHAIDRPQAETLLTQAQAQLNCRDTFIADLAMSLAVHFGPGSIGFVTYPT
ncbi:MAG: DegV family protein [Anaerolineae bacterium]|nr:DegV family protein [Anaerolineae bacterium]